MFTRMRRPVVVVYQETFSMRTAARQREKQLKKWSIAKKHALIQGNFSAVHRLAIRRVYGKKRTED